MDQAPNTTPVPPMPQGSTKTTGSTSSVIAIIVIVLLLAAGGIYYLMMGGAPTTANDTMPTAEEVQNSDDPDVQAALSQSSSDDLSSIEADLNATDFGSVDAAMTDVNSSSAQ